MGYINEERIAYFTEKLLANDKKIRDELKDVLSKNSMYKRYLNLAYGNQRIGSVSATSSNVNFGLPISGEFDLQDGNYYILAEIEFSTLNTDAKLALNYYECGESYTRYIATEKVVSVKSSDTKAIISGNFTFNHINYNKVKFSIFATDYSSDISLSYTVTKLLLIEKQDLDGVLENQTMSEYINLLEYPEKSITKESLSDELLDIIFKKEEPKEIDVVEPIFDLFKDYSNREVKIVIVGDSTSDGDSGPSAGLYNRLKYHCKSGELLDGATIIDRGSNGTTLQWFLSHSGLLEDCKTLDADLYVFSYGINDVRQGGRTKEELKADIVTAVNGLLENEKSHVLLRIPNSLGTDDTSETYITPYTSAQDYTDILWSAYMELKNKWNRDRVAIIDMQTLVFGRTCKPSADNTLMMDVLHPSTDYGQVYIADVIANAIGKKEKLNKFIVNMLSLTNDKPYEQYPLALDDSSKYKLVLEKKQIGVTATYFGLGDCTKSELTSVASKGDIVRFGNITAIEFNPTSYNTDDAKRKVVCNQNLSALDTTTIYNKVETIRIYKKIV